MIVSLYSHAQDNIPAPVDLSWSELVELLTVFPPPVCAVESCLGRQACPAKNGPAWSPVEVEGTRLNDNVRAMTLVVLDLDHVTDHDFEAVLGRLRASGVRGVVHTTHSHAPPGDGSYRVALALSRPLRPREVTRVRAALAERYRVTADAQGIDLSRIYYLPTQRGGVVPFATELVGEPVDVDAIVTTALVVAEPPTPPPSTDASTAELCQVLTRVMQQKRAGTTARHHEHATLLGRILSGAPLADVGERDGTLLRVAGLLATWLPPGTSADAALAVVTPSLAAMESPEGEAHWRCVALEKLSRTLTQRAAVLARRASDEAGLRALTRRRTPPSPPSSQPAPSNGHHAASSGAAAAGSNPAEGATCESPWEDGLITDNRGLVTCEHNARLLLTHAPELASMLSWNTVHHRVDVAGGPLAGINPEVLPEVAAAHLQKNWDFRGGATLVSRALLTVAFDNPRDPIKIALDSYAWDGVPRADVFLRDYFGAVEDNHYTRAASRRWLVSLVARALQPGCKCDTMLILEGVQGAKKSSSLEALVGEEFFLDTRLEIGSQDFMMAIAGAWLVELGELASLTNADLKKITSFITSRVDKFRLPYARAIADMMRRCVLVGTTNERQYLRDPTGNRRYVPIKVADLDPARVRRDRELILAEAVQLFYAGERWHFEGEEVALAAEETFTREEGSSVEEAVSRWWLSLDPARRPRAATLLEVAEAALRTPVDRVDRRIRTELGHALHRLGFHARRHRTATGRAMVYEAPENLMTAERRPRLVGNHT